MVVANQLHPPSQLDTPVRHPNQLIKIGSPPMSNSYSLDDLRAALDDEFKPLVITVDGEDFTLVNLLRASKDVRKTAADKLKALEADTVDKDYDKTVSAMEDLIVVITANGRGKKLVAAMNQDVQLMMKVITLWIAESNLGEASSSPS